MRVELQDTIYPRFFTHDGTGAAADADSTPTVNVKEDGGAAFTTGVTVTDDGVGEYYATIECTTANGFEVGKWYEVAAIATVGGVVSKQSLCRFQLMAAPFVAGNPLVDVNYWRGEQPTGLTNVGGLRTVRVDVRHWEGSDDTTAAVQSGLATATALADVQTDVDSANSKLDAIDDFVDTEVAAIKAQTDQLVFVSGKVDSHLGSTGVNVINPSTFTVGAIDARALNDDAVDEIQAGIASGVWAHTIESVGATDYSAADLTRLLVAILAGDGEDLDGPNPLFKSLDGTKTRISGVTNDDTRNATIGDLS